MQLDPIDGPPRNPEQPVKPLNRDDELYLFYLHGYAKHAEATLRGILQPEIRDIEGMWCYLQGVHAARKVDTPKRKPVLLTELKSAIGGVP